MPEDPSGISGKLSKSSRRVVFLQNDERFSGFYFSVRNMDIKRKFIFLYITSKLATIDEEKYDEVTRRSGPRILLRTNYELRKELSLYLPIRRTRSPTENEYEYDSSESDEILLSS